MIDTRRLFKLHSVGSTYILDTETVIYTRQAIEKKSCISEDIRKLFSSNPSSRYLVMQGKSVYVSTREEICKLLSK